MINLSVLYHTYEGGGHTAGHYKRAYMSSGKRCREYYICVLDYYRYIPNG